MKLLKGGGKQYGRTLAACKMIQNMKGLIICPCRNISHMRYSIRLLSNQGFKINPIARLDTSLKKEPFTSRRKLWIEIFNEEV